MRISSLRSFIWIQLICLFFLVLLTPPVAAAFRHLREGMTAPQVEGKDFLSGEKISSERLRQSGSVVVVVFWAGWSGRSLEELAYLKEISTRFKSQSLGIIAVNVEGQEITPAKKQHIEELFTQMELPFPCIIDDGLDLFYTYGTIAVPSTAIIDSTGVLRYGPAGFSLATRDRILDTLEILFGLKAEDEFSPLAIGYQPSKSASRYYRLALRLAGQRMYERALKNLEMAGAADSGFPAPHNLRGDIYLKLDSLDAALKEFDRAVSLDSLSVSAWTGWGEALLKAGEQDLALNRLNTAVRLDSTYTPALYHLGLCLAEKGRVEEALGLLNSALELHAQNARIFYALGQVYLTAGDTGQAAMAMRKALEILYPAR